MELRNLRDIHGNVRRTETDRHAENETSGNEKGWRTCQAHRKGADGEDDTGDQNDLFAAYSGQTSLVNV